jgi:hypothetical protein
MYMDRELARHTFVVFLLTFSLSLSLVPATVAVTPAGGMVAPNSVSGEGSVSQSGPNPCVGTMTEQPRGTTLLSIQGARAGDKTVAMVVGIRPNGEVTGIYNGSAKGRWWLYDVDPLPNGNVLLSSTEPGISVVEEIDPTTGEQVSEHRFEDVLDSHDADLINGDELLLNDMSQDGNARVFVYNRTREEVVWEYEFANHPDAFPRSGGGEFDEDWTHNNDVEQIEPGVFMVSVRNFDQVVAIDRETKEVRWRLGEDENHDVLFEQHNPDYFEGANGTPTVLVADSLNDRVVEYARTNGSWTQTWVLNGGGLDEPRDADRLPNGNTLVVDRRGHRLLEVTPKGEVVWEFYAPWQPYDAERVGTGDESSGPSARQLGATGVHEMTGSEGVDERRTESCYAFLTGWSGGSQLLPTESSASPTTTRSSTELTSQWTEVETEPATTRFLGGSLIPAVVIALLVAVVFIGLRSKAGEN